jgi:hypothetical protein
LRINLSIAWGAVLGLMLFSAARAAPPASAQREIAYLLGFVEASGCQFYRNGSWFDAKKAHEHMRDKYNLLAAGNQIDTTEDFIEKAATKSSLSGQAYKVRCSDGVALMTNLWLRNELARYRTHAAIDAPRALRDAPGTCTCDSNPLLSRPA